MKNILVVVLVAMLMLVFNSCTKYDPLYGVADVVAETPVVISKDMVYIHDNDIYLTDELLRDHKRLTNSPSVLKTHCVLTSTHNKIAYLDGNGTPVIIDTSGNQIDRLTQYYNVRDINWHNGDQTLYILTNNQVYFYGQGLNLPSPLFSVFPSDALMTEIDALHIDEDLNVAYTYRYQKPYSMTSSSASYFYGAAVNYNDPGMNDRKTEIFENIYNPATNPYNTIRYSYYHKVKFCTNSTQQQQFLILGYITNTDENDESKYDIRSWSYKTNSNAVGLFSTPLFSQSYYDEQMEGHLSSNVYTLQKYIETLPSGLPGNNNTVIYDFSNANDNPPSYFDWKP